MADAPKSMNRDQFESMIIHKAWKDENYKKALLANPKAVLEKELNALKPGTKLPDNLKVQVVEENPTSLTLVIPQLPTKMGAELSDKDLENVAGGVPVVVVVVAVLIVVVL